MLGDDKLDFERRFDRHWNRMEKTQDGIFKFAGAFFVVWLLFALLMLAAASIGVYWMFTHLL